MEIIPFLRSNRMASRSTACVLPFWMRRSVASSVLSLYREGTAQHPPSYREVIGRRPERYLRLSWNRRGSVAPFRQSKRAETFPIAAREGGGILIREVNETSTPCSR